MEIIREIPLQTLFYGTKFCQIKTIPNETSALPYEERQGLSICSTSMAHSLQSYIVQKVISLFTHFQHTS